VLSQLVLVADDESTVTSRRVPWSALRNDAENKLVQALVDAHLFVSDLQAGTAAFGIAHEALLRRWPRVVAWIDEHRQALQVRSRISAQANRWQDSGRKRDMLLPSGTQANQARQLLKTPGFSFTQQEQDFVQASLMGVRRGERLRLAVTVLMTGLAVLAVGLGLTARSAQTQAEAHRTEAEGLMGYMLGEFAEKLRPLGKLDLLDSVSNRALKYLSDPERATDSDTALAQRAKSLQLISEVRIARSDPVGANTALLAGRDILQQQLRSKPTDLALLKNAGENAFWLGQIHYDQKEWDKAQQYFEEYRIYADRQSAASPDDVSGWIEQSYAHNTLGTLALQRSDAKRAASEFALSVELKTRAYKKTPQDKQLAADLADSFSWQASSHMQLGQLAEAESLCDRALKLSQSLHAAYPEDALWVTHLAGVWSRKSELKQTQGDMVGSHNDAQQAFTLLHGIAEKDPSNRNWQRKAYIAELRLIDTDKDQKLSQAFSHLEKLQQAFTQLSSLEPKTLNLQVLIAMAQQRKAAILMQQSQPTEAAQILEPALNKLKQLHAAAPTDITITTITVDALLLNAELGRMRDNLQADGHCEAARTMLRPLVNDSADFQLLAPWVKAHACLNQSERVDRIKKQLEAMPYRDAAYLHYLSTHPPKKASL
jgi:tetratricopeptide (TPR) repeat protein